MTSEESLERFGSAMLNTLEEAAPEESVSDEECRALILFAESAVAVARLSQLDRAREERLRAEAMSRTNGSLLGGLGQVSLEVLRRLVERMTASAPQLVMQHRELSDMTRVDLESLVRDMVSLGISADPPDKSNG